MGQPTSRHTVHHPSHNYHAKHSFSAVGPTHPVDPHESLATKFALVLKRRVVHLGQPPKSLVDLRVAQEQVGESSLLWSSSLASSHSVDERLWSRFYPVKGTAPPGFPLRAYIKRLVRKVGYCCVFIFLRLIQYADVTYEDLAVSLLFLDRLRAMKPHLIISEFNVHRLLLLRYAFCNKNQVLTLV